ncbi:hypothetical protein PI125_g20564 [Phytophthora idaei]|nr:hypothetical protein PI125_g20564 [Phytophthora idaei]KAG3133739.1 hypothetical protein PI126_g19034 [Phytophthora idaei]
MTDTVVWDATRGFKIKLTQQYTTHNHALSSESYRNHPANLRVENEHMIDFVHELQAAEAKKKLKLQFLRKKTGKHKTLGDDHNIVVRLNEARRGSTIVE